MGVNNKRADLPISHVPLLCHPVLPVFLLFGFPHCDLSMLGSSRLTTTIIIKSSQAQVWHDKALPLLDTELLSSEQTFLPIAWTLSPLTIEERKHLDKT